MHMYTFREKNRISVLNFIFQRICESLPLLQEAENHRSSSFQSRPIVRERGPFIDSPPFGEDLRCTNHGAGPWDTKMSKTVDPCPPADQVPI